MTEQWIAVTDRLPPEGQPVETKIDDARGMRNVATLKRYAGLWFLPDGSMYVYYTPTHWLLTPEERSHEG